MTVTESVLTTEERRVDDLVTELLAKYPPKSTDPVTFLGAQFDAGLAWVHFPVGHGGLGLNPKMQKLVNERVFALGAPHPVARNPIGYGMCGPTVAVWGSDEQKARYLRPLFTGEEIWCQLFSEPGAGSDFAGLSSRGVKDGDEWICNGQKVWTTLAHLARWGLLVVRTDTEAVKHAGLTAFVVDMHAPTVEVRPLRQITGEAEFNEVYLTDVRIPDDNRIGAEGEGWRVSLTTLMNERSTIGGGGGGSPKRGSGGIGEAVKIWQALPADKRMAAQKDQLMKMWVRAECLRLTNMRGSENRKAGNPGPEGSVAKLAMAEFNKALFELCIDMLGADAMVGYDYTFRRPDSLSTEGLENGVRHAFMRVRANSIEGGTSEIMRNILGEQVLGLPGEPRVDKDVPWISVPRS